MLSYSLGHGQQIISSFLQRTLQSPQYPTSPTSDIDNVVTKMTLPPLGEPNDERSPLGKWKTNKFIFLNPAVGTDFTNCDSGCDHRTPIEPSGVISCNPNNCFGTEYFLSKYPQPLMLIFPSTPSAILEAETKLRTLQKTSASSNEIQQIRHG